MLALSTSCAYAGGGPLGIDHEWTYDNSGIWATRYEAAVEYGALAFEVGGALWLGNENEFGHTLWESIDATALGEFSAAVLKYGLQRARPNQGDNPDKWLQGSGYDSFPSGQVTLQASFVTPIILRYAHDDPWIWALEALPVYDGLARLKHQDHCCLLYTSVQLGSVLLVPAPAAPAVCRGNVVPRHGSRLPQPRSGRTRIRTLDDGCAIWHWAAARGARASIWVRAGKS